MPNRYGGRENLEAIDFLRRLNAVVAERCPGAVTIAEESTAWPGVTAPSTNGGLGFAYKWNMGWMHDTLSYIGENPVHRRWHHSQMTFGLLYAFSERFVLPLSHDEVVHGKGSLLRPRAGRCLAESAPPCAPISLSCGPIPARSCCSWVPSSASSANGTTMAKSTGAC